MKKLLLTTILVAGFTAGVLAQGFFIDLTGNTGVTSTDTSNGLLYLASNGSPLSPATYPWINVEVFAASSSASVMSSPIVTLTGAINGPANEGGGMFYDNSGSEYTIPSVAANANAYLDVEWWTGTATSYATATGLIGNTGIFMNPTGGGGSPPSTPPGLTGMPSVDMVPVPEPAICTLVGMGLASLLIFRRRQ